MSYPYRNRSYVRSRINPRYISGRGAYSYARPYQKRYMYGRGAYSYRKPRRRMVAGRGDYRSFFRGVGNVAKKVVGGVRKVLNTPVGQAVTGLAGKALMKWVSGGGDYNVGVNSLMGAGGAVDSLPQFKAAKDGVRLCHREYVMDINSSSNGAFSISTISVQPGSSEFAPWLSQIAPQFQRYKILGAIFEYKAQSCDVSSGTSTSMGTVVMSTNLNVLASQPANAQQMYQMDYTSSCKPSDSCMHPLECSHGEQQVPILDVRIGSTGSYSNADLRLYDFANFNIATVGTPQTAVQKLGELWITYDVQLLSPILGTASDVADHYSIGTTQAGSSPLGTAAIAPSSTSDLGSSISGQVLTIPASYTGVFLTIFTANGSSTAACVGPLYTSSSSITGAPSLFAGAHHLVNASASTSQFVAVSFWTAVGGGTITFGVAGTLPSSATGGDLFVIAIPSTLTN